jgi:hypothetical protein
MSEQQFSQLVRQLNAIVGPIRAIAVAAFLVGLWVARMQFQIAAHATTIEKLVVNDNDTRLSVRAIQTDLIYIRKAIDRRSTGELTK